MRETHITLSSFPKSSFFILKTGTLPWCCHHPFQYRPEPIVAHNMEEQGQIVPDDDNDSFASADDIGVLNVAFDDAIDNLTRWNNFLTFLYFNFHVAASPMTISLIGQSAAT